MTSLYQINFCRERNIPDCHYFTDVREKNIGDSESRLSDSLNERVCKL